MGAVFDTGTYCSAIEVASRMLPKLEIDFRFSQGRLQVIKEFKTKSVGMGDTKKMTTFIKLGGITTSSWYEHKDFKNLGNL